MNKKLNNMQKIFFNTNQQKVLRFLAQNPNRLLMASEIIKATKVSKAGVNIALRQLAELGLAQRSIKGKTYLYQINHRDPLVKQLKVLEKIVEIYPLIKKLQELSRQIILFGSAARGENLQDSDIDLFVLTRAEEETKHTIKNFDRYGKIKSIVKNSSSFAKLEKEDPVFYQEIIRGITLWELYE